MRITRGIFYAVLFCIVSESTYASGLSWAKLKEKKEGTITIHYSITEPFMIQEADGSLSGLEYEMMTGFKYFLWNKYGISIHLEWVSHESFSDVLEKIKSSPKEGEFGLDIVSWTRQREQEVGFSKPYFPDIQVLVSDKSIPTTNSVEELKENFGKYTAVSVKGTTYEQYLQNLRKNHEIDFDIIYKPSSSEILTGILEGPKRFGYVDLTNYLIALNRNQEIKRQPVLPIKGVGFCVIFKKHSNWANPLNEYLSSPEYDILKNKGIEKYFGKGVYDLIENILKRENEEMVLLIKEKEMVDKELSERSKQIQRQAYVTNILLACIFVAIVLAFALFNRSKVKSKANEILKAHRSMIESQNELLSKRNNELLDMDEEKNNFISILSHDLRAPINNISGLAGLLQMDDNLTKEQIKSIQYIASEALRLNKMVTRILDIERIEKESIDDFSKIDLKSVLKKILKNYTIQAKEKNIKLHLKTPSDVYAMGLEQYFFHVFENLLSNAIKFSPLHKSIHIEVKTINNTHHISFIDEGPGLTKEDQKKMFKKFQRLSAKPTGGERSTGLGLSIVAKYTKLLNGQLEWQSTPGHGATFIVKLSSVDLN